MNLFPNKWKRANNHISCWVQFEKKISRVPNKITLNCFCFVAYSTKLSRTKMRKSKQKRSRQNRKFEKLFLTAFVEFYLCTFAASYETEIFTKRLFRRKQKSFLLWKFDRFLSAVTEQTNIASSQRPTSFNVFKKVLINGIIFLNSYIVSTILFNYSQSIPSSFAPY